MIQCQVAIDLKALYCHRWSLCERRHALIEISGSLRCVQCFSLNLRKRFCNQWSMWYSDPSLSGHNRICRCVWVYLYMLMYVCACIGIYAHIYMYYILNRYYDTFAVAAIQNVPTVPPLTAREGSFTDHIAEEMQRKFIKDMKSWECFFLTMFRRLQGSNNKFRCIQHYATLNLQNSAWLYNHFRPTVNIPRINVFWFLISDFWSSSRGAIIACIFENIYHCNIWDKRLEYIAITCSLVCHCVLDKWHFILEKAFINKICWKSRKSFADYNGKIVWVSVENVLSQKQDFELHLRTHYLLIMYVLQANDINLIWHVHKKCYIDKMTPDKHETIVEQYVHCE